MLIFRIFRRSADFGSNVVFGKMVFSFIMFYIRCMAIMSPYGVV